LVFIYLSFDGLQEQECTLRHLLFLAALSVIPCAAQATTTDLIAGKSTVVGTVTITDDGKDLNISIEMDDDYAYSEAHVQAGCHLSEIPTNKKGNPKIGLFDYKVTGTCALDGEWSYSLKDLDCKNKVVVAVHAVVNDVTGEKVGDLSASATLEDDAEVTFHKNRYAYYETDVDDQTFDGWCVDLGHVVSYRTYWGLDPISSYSKDSHTYVDKPLNLDLVNYIINQDYSKYQWQSVQEAIWVVIDDANRSLGGRKGEAAAIVKDALAHGEGYTPDVDGVYAVLLVLDTGGDGEQDVQVTIVEEPVPIDPVCGTKTETAWSDGTLFSSKGSWATYTTHYLSEKKRDDDSKKYLSRWYGWR
jgi:hypothetical protein